MILLCAFLWCMGFVVSSTVIHVINGKDTSVFQIILLAFFWPLLGLFILYLMVRYPNKE